MTLYILLSSQIIRHFDSRCYHKTVAIIVSVLGQCNERASGRDQSGTGEGHGRIGRGQDREARIISQQEEERGHPDTQASLPWSVRPAH